MNIIDIIEKKKNKQILNEQEIEYFIDGYTFGDIKDYQAAALLMAICLNGLNKQETIILTQKMALSGDKIDLSTIKGIKVDKHSSGGVGDKVTPIIASIVSSCGVSVAKMSGRGLGFTGGTLDKLESIPGFKTDLTFEEIVDNVSKIGICIGGQTKNLVPADKKLYALRDVTGTVNSIPLIASSIMSKKLVCGCDVLVLDIKVGSGALIKSIQDAEKLSRLMVEIGTSSGIKTIALITNMNEPLGCAVGNSLEIIEVIDFLKNTYADKDLKEICITISANILLLSNITDDYDKAVYIANEKIVNGQALAKFREMIKYQHGNENVIYDYSLFPKSLHKFEVVSKSSGYVQGIECEQIGKTSVICGAGRETKEDDIDFGAGISIQKKCGDIVNIGDTLAIVYTNKIDLRDEIDNKILNSYSISKDIPKKEPLIYNIISKY